VSFDFKRAIKKEVNVGLNEQKIRYGAGSVLLLISVFLGNIALLLIGIVLVATGFTRWCPVYSGLNRTTVDPNEPAKACCGHDHSHGH